MASPKTAYIAIGSNIAPEVHIPSALDKLAAACSMQALSTIYRCPALDRPEQNDYLNGVCQVETVLHARTLKYRVLRTIEAALGRERDEDAYAPRTIDLDVLLLGDMVIDEPGLRIPDPGICTRPFVALPLYEIAPTLRLPDTGVSLQHLVAAMDASMLAPETTLTETLKARFVS